MKIRVIEQGSTEFTADARFAEKEIRAALASGDDAVRSAIMDATDMERETSTYEYITVTEDDGTVLWSGWLTGAKDKPAPGGGTGWARDHARRYMEARYGKDVWYRAPETFENAVEQWIWAVAGDVPELAETCMAAIERHFGERQ